MRDEAPRSGRRDARVGRDARDRELGLFAPITRRDVLHGASAALIAAFAAPWASLASRAAADLDGEYPPARTGMRGSHPGSFEVAHDRARAGRTWRSPQVLDETYDLAVVGGGLSGLAAAYYYRAAAGKDARILILDNHDDFGGHARRNEFRQAGRTYAAMGGSVFLEYGHFSDVTHRLIRELGVDIAELLERQDLEFLNRPLGLRSGIYFDADTYGKDVVVQGDLFPLGRRDAKGVSELARRLEAMPLPEPVRRELERFLTQRADYLAEVPSAQKPAALSKLSYRDFLCKRAGLSDAAADLFQRSTHAYWGAGIDAVPAWNAMREWGLPGWRGLGAYGAGVEKELAGSFAAAEGAIFADGNASIARLLVRALIPGAAPGDDMHDVVRARFDYARLDRSGAPVRLRLGSTAVHVDRLAEDAGVDVTYVRGGSAQRVRARNCVLACDHAMIPHLCPALPQEQKRALGYGVRTPLVSSNVLLRSGAFLTRLGAAGFYSPGRLHSMAFALGPCEGRDASNWSVEGPTVLQLFAAIAPPVPGATIREQFRQGRKRLLGMSFEDFEREIREHLSGLLGATGFDAARDILAITVNRWPHGYAYQQNSLFDPEWPKGGAPYEIGRRRFGRIAIANSDAAWHAYVDGAVDEAHRAVEALRSAGMV
ncbi:MAG TPA: NAD(P)-binding protein [Myxococcota bacterium]